MKTISEQFRKDGAEIERRVSDWWPLCSVCKQVVDNLEIVPLPARPDKYQRAIRKYTVTCHGRTEEHLLGIWAAFEMERRRKRLPDAFVEARLRMT